MGKDSAEKRLEEWNDVFADIFDNLLFGGERVIEADTLVPLPTVSYTRQTDGTLRSGIRDIRKADRTGSQYRLICGIENQTGVDNTMPQRVMGYDYADYEEQIRKIMDQNKQAGRPAYEKRIHDDQRLVPVVTIVLYYGKDGEEWKRPKDLHDMMNFPEGIEKQIRPYVANYPMNLIQVTKLTEKERGMLKSDFRLIAEYLACGNDERRLRRFLQADKQVIRHTEEVLGMMKEFTNNREYRDISRILNKEEKKKGGLQMLDIAKIYKNEGISQGINQGINQGITRGVAQGFAQAVEAVIQYDLRNQVPGDQIVEKLIHCFSISPEKAAEYLDRCVRQEV